MNNNIIKLFIVSLGLSLFTVSSVFAQGSVTVDFEYDPLFEEANFLPGDSVTRYVEVTNDTGETKDIGVKLINFSDPDNLGDQTNMRIYEGTTDYFDDTLTVLSNQSDGVALSSLSNGQTIKYYFEAIFNPTSDNDYQGKQMGFDIVMGTMNGEENGGPVFTSLGGTVIIPGLRIFNEEEKGIEETSATVTWQTNLDATSQIIYSSVDEGHTLDINNPPLYGYAHAYPVPEDSSIKTGHEIILLGLDSCTDYYYRIVAKTSSSGKPTISEEFSFTTACVKGVETEKEEDKEDSNKGTTTPPTGGISPTVEGATTEEKKEEPIVMLPLDIVPERPSGLLASIGDIFGEFGSICYPNFPWWIILIFAVYPILLMIFGKEEERKREVKRVSILSIVVILILFIIWLLSECLSIWIIIISGLLYILIIFFLKERKY